MIIHLRSTSNLLNKNINWKFLADFSKLKFSEYGEIFSLKNINKNKSIEINLVFLNDILNINNNDYSVEVKKIEKLLKKLKHKLIHDPNPVIVGVSAFSYINEVEAAQTLQKEQSIKNLFLNELYKLTKKNKKLYILDIDSIFAIHGLEKCFDNRNYYLSRCRFSSLGIETLSKSLKKILNRIASNNKKVLLLDCDNTLWGGVIAEDGIGKIKIGEEGEGLAFYEFQKVIKKLKNQGILIALLSKNIKADVLEVFNKHDFMVLNKKDICSFKINWQDKSQNIKELSKEIDLNMDSFVFWDDNPIEREKIKIQCKDVDVIEPDIDVSNWAKQLLEYDGFSKFNITKTDIERTIQYKNRQEFISNKANYKNEIDYLKSIKIKPKLLKIKDGNLDRTVQMCQKTNQFNLSSKRYNHSQIKELNKNHICFLVELSDVYGNHGIVSFVCLKNIEKKIFIDSFLMSCRVLGRYLENWILHEIIKISKKKKSKPIIAEFTQSLKNKIAREFLKNNNFRKVSSQYLKNFKKEMNYSLSKNKSEFFLLDQSKKIDYLDIYGKKRK